MVASTRRRLVDSAMALFAEQGFEGTSVEDIAARAGVGRTTFFRHFPTKDDLIAAMAAGDPGADGKYRVRQPAARIDQVLEWARSRDGILFLDIQPGRSRVQDELPPLRRWLVEPDVHLALDPEWNMGPNGLPGRTIG